MTTMQRDTALRQMPFAVRCQPCAERRQQLLASAFTASPWDALPDSTAFRA